MNGRRNGNHFYIGNEGFILSSLLYNYAGQIMRHVLDKLEGGMHRYEGRATTNLNLHMTQLSSEKQTRIRGEIKESVMKQQ